MKLYFDLIQKILCFDVTFFSNFFFVIKLIKTTKRGRKKKQNNYSFCFASIL